jgi:hypothetical protein
MSVLFLLLLGCGVYFVFVYVENFQQKEQVNEVNNMRKVKQNGSVTEQDYQPVLNVALKLLEIPEGYELNSVFGRKQNESDVWVFRYERLNGENNGLNGEHYSFTVDNESHEILGVTWMDQRFASGQQLPSEKLTKELAQTFLNRTQPGLFDRLENHWIRPHDELITANGKKVIVTGMKYKCYLPEEDTWAWVIVGPEEKIITFEQRIKWEGGRLTEKWLHDIWLDMGNKIN